jgi:hypothetical protein
MAWQELVEGLSGFASLDVDEYMERGDEVYWRWCERCEIYGRRVLRDY